MPDKDLKWSDRSLEENRRLTIYLYNEWGEEIALRIQEQIDKAVIRIQRSPEHFQIFSKRKNIRRCVLSPQTSIFFREHKQDILIISIFDNRQSPKKRKL
jgi:plasmid stabilization system protein ParE